MISETLIGSETLEEQLIGRLLINAHGVAQVASILTRGGKDFAIVRHEWVYDSMVRLTERGMLPELDLIADDLQAQGQYHDIGGMPYLAYLVSNAGYSFDLNDLAWRVKEYAYERQLLGAASAIADIARESSRPIEKRVQEAEDRLASITTTLRKQQQGGLRPLGEFVDNNLLDMEQAFQAYQEGRMLGLGTGLSDLDNYVRLKPGILITIAARPRVGKSALMQSIIYHHLLAPFVSVDPKGNYIHLHGGKFLRLPDPDELEALPKFALFSAEMSEDQNMNRFAAMLTGVSADDQENGRLNFEQFQDVQRAKYLMTVLHEHLLIKTGRITPRFILEETRLWQPDAIFADYLQKMAVDTQRKTKREEVSDISGALKEIALEMAIPVVTGAQINREGASKPELEHLKESGSIEEDSDVVLLLHREELINEFGNNANKAEIIIAKNRNGRPGKIDAFYRKHETRFLGWTNK